MTDALCYCNPKVTAVIEANIKTVWDIVSQWSSFYFLSDVAGETCEIKLYEGLENMIGAVRSVAIGPSLMFERLVAMDEETHIMKWRTINHPDSVTPFAEASYINALLSLELREITHDDHTFAEWEVGFYTEQQYAPEMYQEMEHWLTGALGDLQKHVFTPNPTVNQREMELPGSQMHVQAQYPQDHLSKFADLHLETNPDLLLHPVPGQHYPAPMLEPRVGQGPRGIHSGQQSGKPMGTTAQAYDAQQSWRDPQLPLMHPSLPESYHPPSEPMLSSQEWSQRQQGENRTRQRAPPMGRFGPDSDRGSIESMERPAVSTHRPHRRAEYPRPPGVPRGRNEYGLPSWDPAAAPMAAPPMAGPSLQSQYVTQTPFDQPDYYNSDTRSRAGSSRGQYRGTR